MHSQNTPQIIEHVNLELNSTIHDVQWADGTCAVLAGGEKSNKKGCLNIYELNKGTFKSIEEHDMEAGIKSLCTFYSHTGAYSVVCGDFNGSVMLYDIQDMNTPIYKIKKHSSLINKVDCRSFKDNKIIVTAGRDGSVGIFDIRTCKETVRLEPNSTTSYIPDCWSVATGNAYTCTFGSYEKNDNGFSVCAGYDNGDIKYFDMRAMNVEYEVNVNNGVCSLAFDRKEIKQNKLIGSTLEGNIYMFNLDVYNEQQGYGFSKDKVSSGTCWGTPFLPQNRDIFACLGGDGNLSLYKYQNPLKNYVYDEETGYKKGILGEIIKLSDLNVSTQPIVSLNWNPRKTGLCALSSLDQTIKVCIVTKLDLY